MWKQWVQLYIHRNMTVKKNQKQRRNSQAGYKYIYRTWLWLTLQECNNHKNQYWQWLRESWGKEWLGWQYLYRYVTQEGLMTQLGNLGGNGHAAPNPKPCAGSTTSALAALHAWIHSCFAFLDLYACSKPQHA